jgi:pimeloyl-ACP methyl ester carboxylesterase
MRGNRPDDESTSHFDRTCRRAHRAIALLPAASQWRFEGVGHCVAQEAPALLLQALKAFEADAG